MIAIGEHLGLERQERAAGIDEIDARQTVLQRDLLGADVLFHRQGIVGSSLDRCVVGDDQDLPSRHAADAGDDAGRRRPVVVEIPCGERRQFQKRRTGIEQLVDALADRQLPLGAVPLEVFLAAAESRLGGPRPQLRDERDHAAAVALEVIRSRIDVRRQPIHQTDACDMRGIIAVTGI